MQIYINAKGKQNKTESNKVIYIMVSKVNQNGTVHPNIFQNN
uniref:Uncharacterized protein n=1 Tax=Anguilla anguilla TaxID=7936 RepID=A0A0E9RYP7_ANGAN